MWTRNNTDTGRSWLPFLMGMLSRPDWATGHIAPALFRNPYQHRDQVLPELPAIGREGIPDGWRRCWNDPLVHDAEQFQIPERIRQRFRADGAELLF